MQGCFWKRGEVGGIEDAWAHDTMGGRTERGLEVVDTSSWNWKERLKCFEVGYGPLTRG